MTAKPYTQRLYSLEASTDLIDVRITGHGRLADGSIDEMSLGSRTFCLRADECRCPDGTTPDSATPLSPTGALLALTGGPGETTGSLQGRDLDCTVPVTSTAADVCSLITDAEVAAVLGVPITRHETGGTPDAGWCTKGSERQDITAMADVYYVSFVVNRGELSLFAEASQEAGVHAVSGVGEQAVFISAGAIIGVAGGAEFSVQVYQGGQVGTEADAAGLARLLVSRL